MPKGSSRTARIEARITPEALAIVKRCAEIQGRSLSDFVAAAAREAVHLAIEEGHLIRLSVEDRRRFVDGLQNPPDPSPSLAGARMALARLIRESR
jgi:uncharacterized protein (DUF1778 family)